MHACMPSHFSHVQLFVTPQTVARQALLSMGFSRKEYWSSLPFPSPEDLPNAGIKLGSSALQAESLLSEPPEKPLYINNIIKVLLLMNESKQTIMKIIKVT